MGVDRRMVVRALPLRARGRRGNYSDTELEELASKVAALNRPAFVYFNNDWEGFAVSNARRMRALLA